MAALASMIRRSTGTAEHTAMIGVPSATPSHLGKTEETCLFARYVRRYYVQGAATLPDTMSSGLKLLQPEFGVVMPARNATDEDARLFDAALMASVVVIHDGELG